MTHNKLVTKNSMFSHTSSSRTPFHFPSLCSRPTISAPSWLCNSCSLVITFSHFAFSFSLSNLLALFSTVAFFSKSDSLSLLLALHFSDSTWPSACCIAHLLHVLTDAIDKHLYCRTGSGADFLLLSVSVLVLFFRAIKATTLDLDYFLALHLRHLLHRVQDITPRLSPSFFLLEMSSNILNHFLSNVFANSHLLCSFYTKRSFSCLFVMFSCSARISSSCCHFFSDADPTSPYTAAHASRTSVATPREAFEPSFLTRPLAPFLSIAFVSDVLLSLPASLPQPCQNVLQFRPHSSPV